MYYNKLKNHLKFVMIQYLHSSDSNHKYGLGSMFYIDFNYKFVYSH